MRAKGHRPVPGVKDEQRPLADLHRARERSKPPAALPPLGKAGDVPLARGITRERQDGAVQFDGGQAGGWASTAQQIDQQGKGTEPQDDAGHVHEGPTLARGRGDPHAVEDDSTQGITGHT